MFNSRSGDTDQMVFVQNATKHIVFKDNTYLAPYLSKFITIQKTERNAYGRFPVTESTSYRYNDDVQKTLSGILGDKTAKYFVLSFPPVKKN